VTAPPPETGFSLWRWLKGLLAPEPAPTAAPAPRRGRGPALAAQEEQALAEFCRHFGLRFRDTSLLKLALTHRSYLSVTGQGPRESNERLEFLGDSVLGLVTSEHLYRTHPNEHEGQLTKAKSLLVSKAILSRRALAIGLGRFVLMSHSEVESGGRQRLSILADAFESVIGAIYLDQGFEAARAFIHRHLLREAGEIVADKRHTNYKSGLQEFVQSTFRTHPVYRIRSEAGPDHSKYFLVEVCVGRRVLGEGKGRNKKEAEQAAARNALERVGAGGTRAVRSAPPEEEPAPRHRPESEAPPQERAGPEAPRTAERRGTSRRPVEPPAREPEAAERRRARRDAESTGEAPSRPAFGARRASGGIAIPPEDGRFARLREEMLVSGGPEEAAEYEPVEPVLEEDFDEEVGRPEGPREERRVDVFDDRVEAPEAVPATADEPAPDLEDEPSRAVETADADRLDEVEFEGGSGGESAPSALEAPSSASGAPRTPTRYGRRRKPGR